ncbi:MAG: hypothetical protein ISS31_10265 [Kiritimatiellae bacterium]|nr:hypothetical protein [Kiritimatiellia bacterium]
MGEQPVGRSSIRISKQLYLSTMIGVWLLAIVSTALAFAADERFGVVSILARVILFVIILRFWYQAWSAIQDGHARTTPGKAAGFLCIPLFNFYWVFQVTWGFAQDFNSYTSRHGLRVNPLDEKLFLAIPILSLVSLAPVVGLAAYLAEIVLYLIAIVKICDGVNAFGEGRQ